ncbi:MAG: DMT family transporter [Gammaproteobacteria bacterium]|nr:DMT family transporter [Gammaproteobacteria bacterium]
MKGKNLAGIGFMLASMAVLSLMDASMKALSEHYPPFQVAFLRGAFSVPFILAWALFANNGFKAILPRRPGLHLARGILAVVLLGTFIYALSSLPLSETYTLVFVAPLIITLLSVLLLKEKVSAGHWLAIFIGFIGVAIVFRPGFHIAPGLGAIAALFSALCYAVIAILTRMLGKSDTTLSMSFSFVFLLSVGAGLLAIPGWRALQIDHAVWFVILGVAGALGQYLLTEAFSRAEASAVAPFEYTALFWGLLFDAFIWHSLPEIHVYAGATIIIMSGVYILRHQHSRTPPPELP